MEIKKKILVQVDDIENFIGQYLLMQHIFLISTI